MTFAGDALGAAFTVVSLGALLVGGYLTALVALDDDEGDALALLTATLLATLAHGIGIGLALGSIHALHIEIAVAVELGLVVLLLLAVRRTAHAAAPFAPLARALGRAFGRVGEHAPLAIVAAHAVGAETLRGLLRPPMTWDSLVYHLYQAASWLHTHDLTPPFGAYPLNYVAFYPANNSIWVWWFLAPSHTELYANLPLVPQIALFALAVGGVARELGARRAWPVAGLLAVAAPAVVRWTSSQYSDVLVGAALTSAVFFGLRWLRAPRLRDALLVGAALGLAMGAKVVGAFYGVVLAIELAALARGAWRARAVQLAAGGALAALLGSYFFLRNLALGLGPAAGPRFLRLATRVVCDPDLDNPLGVRQREQTIWAKLSPLWSSGTLTDTFLGTTAVDNLEIGAGPVALALLGCALALPFALKGDRRRAGLVVSAQIAAQLLLFVFVPLAYPRWVLANMRYIDGATGLAFAALVVLLEVAGASLAWIAGIAAAIAAQHLLQQHMELPREVRLGLLWLDVAVVVLAVAPRLRAHLARHLRWYAPAAVAVSVLLAPSLAQFRAADRERAYREEYGVHATQTSRYARAWALLDQRAGDQTVAVTANPYTVYPYPAMGMRLSRQAVYVGHGDSDSRFAGDYPNCDPRKATPSFEGWMRNLDAAGARWVLASRGGPGTPFPPEARWADEHPELFRLEMSDDLNRVYRRLRPRAQGAGDAPAR